MLKFDYLKKEKSFQSEVKSIFLVSQVLSFRHTKQISKNVADTTFKNQSTLVACSFFGATLFMNLLGESVQKVFQQLQHARRIKLHKSPHNTVIFES